MKRIGRFCRWNCWRPRRRPSALWGGGGRGDECRHLARHGSGLRPRRVCAAWGMARSSFYAMTSGQHAESGRQSVGDRSPRSRNRRCWWRSKPTWRHRPGRARATARSGLGFGSVATSGLARKRVLRLCARTICSRPIAAASVAANAGEIDHSCPDLMWGTDGVRVFTVDDGWGWIFTAVEHWNAECVGWHVCKRGDRFAALHAALHGPCRAVWLDRGRRGLGAGLADGSRLPVSVGPLRPTSSSSGVQPKSYAFVAVY